MCFGSGCDRVTSYQVIPDRQCNLTYWWSCIGAGNASHCLHDSFMEICLASFAFEHLSRNEGVASLFVYTGSALQALLAVQSTKFHHCWPQQEGLPFRMSLLASASSGPLATRQDVAAHVSRLQNLQVALKETLLVRCSALHCEHSPCLQASMPFLTCNAAERGSAGAAALAGERGCEAKGCSASKGLAASQHTAASWWSA